jgi:hypothetical protein
MLDQYDAITDAADVAKENYMNLISQVKEMKSAPATKQADVSLYDQIRPLSKENITAPRSLSVLHTELIPFDTGRNSSSETHREDETDVDSR